MIFNIGEKVLLLHLMGEDLEKPVLVTITDPGTMRSLIYDYSVELPKARVTSDSGFTTTVINQQVYVRADWIVPADIVIEEEECLDTLWI